MRKLRNPMVPEYIEDSASLADALQAGHQFVPTLTTVVNAFRADIRERGWASA
ncbi:hypothetical protein [Thioalkalivibrio sp. ALMg13-2]|uniref:hypothetical protein n=1 Tax=Thioalkalivibrio sp. ALMg13-2 TaxID=1158167 RepID=UPI00039D62ED|nr:hypothetical protein [Thioalkalivibrio sp. ALMg13-2]